MDNPLFQLIYGLVWLGIALGIFLLTRKDPWQFAIGGTAGIGIAHILIAASLLLGIIP